jgi:pimeloyl-ACP methyl ester carboxylesterase
MLKKVLVGAVLVIVVGVLFSSAFNLIYLHHLKQKYPPPGSFYEVNGRRMHLYCTGEGFPTVIIEPGLGGDWLDWQHVQPELSQTTRVCTYDRLGNGWSEPEPGLHDAGFTAPRLHALLQQANERGPFVFIGASMGGLFVREFYAMYPDEVAAIVFSDTSIPEQLTAIPDRDSAEKRKQRHRDAFWQWVREASGWERLRGRCHDSLGPGMQAYAHYGDAESCRSSYSRAWLSESDAFWITLEQAGKVRCCGNLQLVIISQDPDRPNPGWDAVSIWNRLQEDLKQLSPRSRRIIAKGSGHHVMFDRPEVIVSATSQLITELRQKSRDPQEGTTVIQ